MSRAYRVSVKESQNRVIRAEDHVCTDLEILEVLPPEQMGELLSQELEKRGFERDGDKLEGQLQDLRQELDEAVNRVTAEALKRKAAQMGQIKEMTEDETGNLTIVVEV